MHFSSPAIQWLPSGNRADPAVALVSLKPLIIFLITALILQAEEPIRGFPRPAWAEQRRLEEKFQSMAESKRIGEYLRKIASHPHIAGSPSSRAVAEYAAGLMRSWGLDVTIEKAEALLPYPTERVVEMVSPQKFAASLVEPAIGEDSNSGDKDQIPTYNAYSASGDVTAPLVYVNYGLQEDYKVLKEQGIDVKGKIVIARYGKSWRGVKPKVAYENGALACIIYSDPKDDGFFMGDTYPKGPWRPAASAQRGSVMDMALYVGDPLTPGWASEGGAKRLPLEKAATLMKIPVLPLSSQDAKPLLKSLGGPVAPAEWRGALPLTYHMGPGPASVRVKLDFDWTSKPLYNVIATIKGRSFPDEWVIYGNHHDAWVNGANDPASGAASLLETARVLAEMQRQGWAPARTIKVALWDGEEFGLVGSTEWVEKHRDELDRKAIAYINSDANGKGGMGAGGSPSLEQFFVEVLRDVRDPSDSSKSVLETARSRDSKEEKSEFHLGSLGSGSDYVGFVHHVGIAGLNLGFGGSSSGGVYHSIYDSVEWYTRFADSDFRHCKALSGVVSAALLRLAGAPVLPFEYNRFASAVSGYLAELEKLAAERKGQLNLRAPRAELERLQAAARAYEGKLSSVMDKIGKKPAVDLDELNQTLFLAERSLMVSEGLPGRPWYKNQISAPGLYTGYGAKTLPGIREAAEAGRWEEANQQALVVARVLRALTEKIRLAASQAARI